MLTVNIQVSGMDAALAHLEALETQLREGPGVGVMRTLGEAALEDVEARFDTGGYDTWEPLSPVTVEAKGGRTEILIDTGNMRGAVGIGELTEWLVTVTVPHGGRDNDPEVPIRHQLGEPSHWAGGLPQRKIVEVTDQLLERLNPLYHDWVKSWLEDDDA